jgi:hypothetical protein
MDWSRWGHLHEPDWLHAVSSVFCVDMIIGLRNYDWGDFRSTAGHLDKLKHMCWVPKEGINMVGSVFERICLTWTSRRTRRGLDSVCMVTWRKKCRRTCRKRRKKEQFDLRAMLKCEFDDFVTGPNWLCLTPIDLVLLETEHRGDGDLVLNSLQQELRRNKVMYQGLP